MFALTLMILLVPARSRTVQKCTTNGINVIKCTSFSRQEIQQAYDKNKTAVGLDLSNVHMTALASKDFEHMPGIQRLYLDNAKVDDVMLDAFKHLRQLELLSLRNLQSDWSRMVDSIVRHPVGEVDISENFPVCSCDHWHAYFRITTSGTRVRNSTEHHCSMKQIADCVQQTSHLATDAGRVGDLKPTPAVTKPQAASGEAGTKRGGRRRRRRRSVAAAAAGDTMSDNLRATALAELCAALNTSSMAAGGKLINRGTAVEIEMQQTRSVTSYTRTHAVPAEVVVFSSMLVCFVAVYVAGKSITRVKQ